MKIKYFALPLFFLAVSFAATAQEKYTTYTIKKGDNLYSIAHHFHVTAVQLKDANGLSEESILKIGQKIKVPSKTGAQKNIDKTVTKQSTKTPVNTTVPVVNKKQIHIVAGKETLWSIGKKYGITVDQIKEWNHLKNSAIHTGQKLIIAQPQPVVEENPVEQSPVVTTHPEQKVTTPVVEQKSIVEEKKVPLMAQTAPVEQKDVNTAITGKPAGESFFASSFKNTGSRLSGVASTFKTASGWLDKKYYVLINNITEGSIVAVSANNKIVYAKVLGSLPDIKEDAGILLRISNAAASALGITDSKFNVTVNY